MAIKETHETLGESDSVYRPCDEVCVTPVRQPPVTCISFSLLVTYSFRMEEGLDFEPHFSFHLEEN